MRFSATCATAIRPRPASTRSKSKRCQFVSCQLSVAAEFQDSKSEVSNPSSLIPHPSIPHPFRFSPAKAARHRGRRYPPIWPPVPNVWPKFAIRRSGGTTIPSPIAPIAARGGRSSNSCLTTGRGLRWPPSRCVPSARPSTTIRPTGGFMPSRSPVRGVGRRCNCSTARAARRPPAKPP